MDTRDIWVLASVSAYVVMLLVAQAMPRRFTPAFVGAMSVLGILAFVVTMWTLSAIQERKAQKLAQGTA